MSNYVKNYSSSNKFDSIYRSSYKLAIKTTKLTKMTKLSILQELTYKEPKRVNFMEK